MNNIVITAVGDINLSRDIKDYIKKCKNDEYKNIFKYVKKYISNSDISIGNLESIISDNTNNKLYNSGGPSFRAENKSIEALKYSGLNTINISNNHSNDYGSIGINDTINILEKNNFNIIGKKKEPYKIYNIDNCKIIVIGLSHSFERLKNNNNVYVYNNSTKYLLQNLKKMCDLLIVTIHWGTEYKFKNNNKQKKIAKIMIKNGVDIIIGHHPHVIQNMEKININNRYGYIFYSLGNFIFDSHYNKKGIRDTMILKIIIDKNTKKYNFEYLPCIIYPHLGFIPKPTINNFINKYPKKNTIEADNLFNEVFKYLECKKIFNGGNNKYSIKLFCYFIIIFFIYYLIKSLL
jgi:poly-gamma-glutamate synthesis protein (capsule biosynthesis protein)